jgi:hypothetical protein
MRDRFATRNRLAIGVVAAVALIAMLVLAYRLTAPDSTQTTTSSGERIPESDVLRVGALPVT